MQHQCDKIKQADEASLISTLLPNLTATIPSIFDNPILAGFDGLFPKKVPFMDWNIKVFRFMQERMKQVHNSIPIQPSKMKSPRIFLEREILNFVIFLYTLHIRQDCLITDYNGFENYFQPPEGVSRER